MHSALKQAMKNAERRKQPISVSSLQDLSVSKETDPELRHFLISKTEGEALGVIRGAERESGFGIIAKACCALYDPLAAGRSVDDSRQILSPPNVSKIDDLSHAVQAWENFEQRHQERTEDHLRVSHRS